jgi:hypothetical protein
MNNFFNETLQGLSNSNGTHFTHVNNLHHNDQLVHDKESLFTCVPMLVLTIM